jgi:hypothetical protein
MHGATVSRHLEPAKRLPLKELGAMFRRPFDPAGPSRRALDHTGLHPVARALILIPTCRRKPGVTLSKEQKAYNDEHNHFNVDFDNFITRDYPRERPSLPPVYRGVPRLNVSHLTPDEAQAILAADVSGALVMAPRQTSVLFLDLGGYDFSPALAELKREDGTALLKFTDYWASPVTGREELVIPLADGLESSVQSLESGNAEQVTASSTPDPRPLTLDSPPGGSP